MSSLFYVVSSKAPIFLTPHPALSPTGGEDKGEGAVTLRGFFEDAHLAELLVAGAAWSQAGVIALGLSTEVATGIRGS